MATFCNTFIKNIYLYEMEVKDAILELINSIEYLEICKQRDGIGGKYRSYKARAIAGTLGTGAISDLLVLHGYEITANKTVKKKDAKKK